jgi:hypothetical protein
VHVSIDVFMGGCWSTALAVPHSVRSYCPNTEIRCSEFISRPATDTRSRRNGERYGISRSSAKRLL